VVRMLALIGSLLAFSVGLKAQGYIVPNGVIYYGLTPLGYATDVIQNPISGDPTGFFLVPQSETSFRFEPIIDEGVRTFLVAAKDPISLPAILANTYTELGYTPPTSYEFEEGVAFYLGFYTGYNPWDSQGHYTGIYTDPVFGWGRYVNYGGEIEMLDAALEYGGGGIYAGTLTIIPIPEPGSLGLFGVAAVLAVRCWRRRA
jgi:hypothetical protein